MVQFNWLNPRERPIACATAMWGGVALCLFAWNILWVAIDRAGLVQDPSRWGVTIPVWLAAQPWSGWVAFPSARTAAGQAAIFVSLALNALVIGCVFGLALRYTRIGLAVLRWTLRAFSALTILPLFIALLVLNIHLTSTYFPEGLEFAERISRSKLQAILIVVLAGPIPILTGFLYYRLFEFFDRRLLG